MKAEQKAKKYILRSPYKRIVKSAYYRKMSYTARVCMRNPAMKQATLQEVLKVGNGFLSIELLMELLSTILQIIRIECSMLCMTKPTPSVLRVTSLKKLSSFKWEDVNTELQQKAPTLFAILKAAAQPTRSRQAAPLTSMIAMAAGILLKSICAFCSLSLPQCFMQVMHPQR